MGILDNYEAANTAFRTGSVLTKSNETLLQYLHGLSNQNNTNTGTQHRDIIRGLTINNILLQRHIDSLQQHITKLNASSAKIQRWVIALAIASLIAAAVQTTVAIRAEARAIQETKAIPSPQAPSTQPSATQIPTAPPSSRPRTAPKP